MALNTRFFTVGEAAKRCGVATSTLRFYESKGLIESIRTEGNQRRYPASTIRVISVIKAAQQIGVSLEEIKLALKTLPNHKQPTKKDWARMSKQWAASLDQKILEMQRLRDNLDGCIGCGCLSLKSCKLFNPEDTASAQGTGARYLIDGSPTAEDQS
ncbi:redox-sensitive transcriptional activator SoxR [Vibrio breoganii]|uniref:Redox-sensitive transcriptional activator SoxR n=1 Tax=Vibrio breoganii TaxID=553239 RepID=A0AAN1CT44_9VIBR|nr:redox-sensitive transcriptional activator SoxR [Vibrio breoganii]ANO34205.1 redox-sensitive transcriptional activator SoxR [Vibrio breoganii]MDN3715354.1 redox-sensitive transcriptional activator SoxR [Vibrio breoganii]NMO74460.1 redox-sensitive transcriptional activator SoxR [Vibrio breoganii]NMR71777.1 redox-sensitive transcriptional activator SoxR [Vibrio breoganii]OCH76507.1 redox-sensitive transcriptional activator SoxR [Vibrio breoganii]